MFQRHTNAQGYRGRSFAGLLGGSFLTGFWMGLGSLPLFMGTAIAPPRYQSEGIAGDWKAVGSYLSQSMGVIDKGENTEA